jgi:soluble lytic murein transglycosylase-like protein
MPNRSVHNFAHGRLLALLVVLAIFACSGVAVAANSGKPLKIGSSGAAVADVQRVLHQKVTWYYDDATANAVRRFQRAHHLPVDGVVGKATARALHVRLRQSRYPSTGRVQAGSSTGSSVHLPAELRKIARCESGGNPRALSPSGRYRGKYQFDRATWSSIGGHGDPAKASEEVQDRLALKLYRARGKAPWPNCA